MEVRRVSKCFPGVQALSDVSLEIMPGETLAVVGENGAGKSTLMKVMAGIERPDEGELRFRKKSVAFHSPAEAMNAGVALMHQELNLHENLSIAENIFLGREPNRYGWTDRSAMRAQARVLLDRVGLDADVREPLGKLSTASRQLVEVAKALSIGASLVIMDEPTSSLSTRETERLFQVVDALNADGVSVVYISHRLAEVTRLARRVEVLRDGRNAGTLTGRSINHDAMVTAMIGRELETRSHQASQTSGETALRVDQLRVSGGQSPVSFQIDSGEIVAVAGLVGSGRSELLEAIFGVTQPASGEVVVGTRTLRGGDVRDAIAAGLALVPEDRKRTGLLTEWSVRENATLAAMTFAPAAPRLDRRWQQSSTASLVERLNVKTAGQQTVIATLSGGNQQKIALGKWLIRDPAVLLMDEPTRGVDVGAKQEIYNLIRDLAKQGVAVLFVSSELEEVLALAERVLVMHDGAIVGSLCGDEMTEDAIMRLAVGMSNESSETKACT